MQIVGALLVAAGVAVALPGGGDGGYSPKKQECVTSSTCKAVYHTTTKTVPYQETKTITKTEYKPHVYTTKVPKVYTETTYGTWRPLDTEQFGQANVLQCQRNTKSLRPSQSRRPSPSQTTQLP